jgi:hypothetical protein
LTEGAAPTAAGLFAAAAAVTPSNSRSSLWTD